MTVRASGGHPPPTLVVRELSRNTGREIVSTVVVVCFIGLLLSGASWFGVAQCWDRLTVQAELNALGDNRLATSSLAALPGAPRGRLATAVVVPVYRADQPHTTMEERRHNIAGFCGHAPSLRPDAIGPARLLLPTQGGR